MNKRLIPVLFVRFVHVGEGAGAEATAAQPRPLLTESPAEQKFDEVSRFIIKVDRQQGFTGLLVWNGNLASVPEARTCMLVLSRASHRKAQ